MRARGRRLCFFTGGPSPAGCGSSAWPRSHIALSYSPLIPEASAPRRSTYPGPTEEMASAVLPAPRIVRETARPHPHAIAAVVLDLADFDLACMGRKALKRHIRDMILRPGDLIVRRAMRRAASGSIPPWLPSPRNGDAPSP